MISIRFYLLIFPFFILPPTLFAERRSYERSPAESSRVAQPPGNSSQAIGFGSSYRDVYQNIHISGILPLKYHWGEHKPEIINGSIEEQASQVFANLRCKFDKN